MKKIFCFFFGHKVPKDEFWANNNIDYCERCKATRSYAHEEQFFTAREWFGIIRYPFFRLSLWFNNVCYRAQDKKRKKKLKDFYDCPF